jgi:hypothetical protein
MPSLRLRDVAGNLLIDSAYINYGLLASGYLAYKETWYGKTKPAINSDPNQESSWQETTAYSDQIYSFTASGCIAPIVFLAGQGFLEETQVAGNTFTWLFSAASPSTKIFIFDRMRAGGSGPVLMMRSEANVVTFNSRMVPLNIRGGVASPAIGNSPTSESPIYGVLQPYQGGTTVVDRTNAAVFHALGYVDVASGLSEEIAVNITFTRGARFYPGTAVAAYGPHSVSEYAWGNGTSIRFAFRSVAANYLNNLVSSGVVSNQWVGVPTVYPTANYIITSNLPIPFSFG